MNRLLQFLFKYRTLLVFIFLEGICFWVIVRSNSYHNAKYFTTSNQVAGAVLNRSSEVKDYFSLAEKNDLLAQENARLRQLVLDMDVPDSVIMTVVDTSMVATGLSARVIDNSVFLRNNYLTINKGRTDGVTEKMGVLGPDGVVGQVKYVSDHYATIVSLLHSRSLVSSKHAKSGGLCTVMWRGEDPLYADIEYFPRHIHLSIGDSIKTSGYNSIFPEGELVGVVSEVHLDDAGTFYEAQLKLSTDFYRLKHVYLMSLPDKLEIDSLTFVTNQEDGQI
ncbi:hypothetical protein BFP72_18385 [Reichenbachiella sp. 5M10]|uniref:rod shape-determining protein MreC n=1 Tax=Reichenbachiella sp. 5M10 TaxID=1889772 RepID=UPI000C158AAB|nr:rod shape-determining protein MreC [Reichenbachiella sp. 5M10]PIB37234.1 hypothetical protein BFP72_18385 [Reichenbachiella sp. 5M10]